MALSGSAGYLPADSGIPVRWTGGTQEADFETVSRRYDRSFRRKNEVQTESNLQDTKSRNIVVRCSQSGTHLRRIVCNVLRGK